MCVSACVCTCVCVLVSIYVCVSCCVCVCVFVCGGNDDNSSSSGLSLQLVLMHSGCLLIFWGTVLQNAYTNLPVGIFRFHEIPGFLMTGRVDIIGCYKLIGQGNFNEAIRFCQNSGGHLLGIGNTEENTAVAGEYNTEIIQFKLQKCFSSKLDW